MPFEADKLLLTGLARFDLPDRTITLCDGGFVYFDGEKYSSSDPDFGSIESAESFSETAGDEAPGGRITFLPASGAAAATLSQPSYQGSRIRFWLAEVSEQTGEVTGTPELVLDGELDTTTLRIGRGTRVLDIEYISVAERLFAINEGNVLSARFHKSVWPGEQGLDNTTGVGTVIAWGVESPPRGSSVSGAGGGGGARPSASDVIASIFSR